MFWIVKLIILAILFISFIGYCRYPFFLGPEVTQEWKQSTTECKPALYFYLTLNGNIYKMTTMLLETSYWHHKISREMLAEVKNQVRSRVIFS